MVDLRTLSPAERAKQLGNPEGEVGLAIADMMNGVNRPFIDACYDALALRSACRVLEIGFGNGRDVAALMGRAEAIQYTGIDISPTMIEAATGHNEAAVKGGAASFHLGSLESMSFPPASFDRAVAVNVIYFWEDPVKPLAAIHKALAPDGLCVIGAADPSSQDFPFIKAEFGFHKRGVEIIDAAHKQAGFASTHVEIVDHVFENGADGAKPQSYRFNVFVSKI